MAMGMCPEKPKTHPVSPWQKTFAGPCSGRQPYMRTSKHPGRVAEGAGPGAVSSPLVWPSGEWIEKNSSLGFSDHGSSSLFCSSLAV